ncbi:sulfatase-like hydrolase/transferase [Lacibacter sp. H407]|uniref:sulfatase-like hydrolase/transferase n=1 Tax=Lacibacter sp. H407 TaxID=3133423 RepID=UPI0030C38BF6
MKLLHKILPNFLHCFSIPVFFILHNYIDFAGLIDLGKISGLIIAWITAPAVLLFFYWLILRDLSKSALLTSILLSVYFFAAPFMKEIKAVPFLCYFSRYSIFLPLLFISLILTHHFVHKTRKKIERAHLFLNVTILILLSYEIFQLSIYGFASLKERNAIVTQNNTVLNKIEIKEQIKPDIFFLIFDEHPSTKSLHTLFNYNNNSLDSSLSKLDFRVSAGATSAYHHTVACIYSLLGLTEFSPKNSNELILKQQYAINIKLAENRLVPFLQTNGYTFINASMFDFKDNKSLVRKYIHWNSPEDMIQNQTILRKVKQDIGWNFTSFYKKAFITDFNRRINDEVIYTKRINQLIDSSLTIDTIKPKFFYGHFFLPHDPFKFDEKGNTINWSYESYKNQYHTTATYLNQVKYANKTIIELANKILRNNKRPSIIIIQGDHGNRRFDLNKFPQDHKQKILSAIYFPDKDYSQIPDDLYSPNTFRIILNKYFQQQIPLLKK